ncbi:protealysin inhibitor emfourin [Massilia sp. METH4]|uniref:protealysin inhibitor emfourin n=1 Tax=Massilia sp. METH4 TaxID=3123041 RepID=UPI0030CC8985
MKIIATKSGGFAGLTQTHEVDTATSPAGQALEAELASSALFSTMRGAAEEPVGADIPRWTITLEGRDGERRSVSFAEDGSPASARWRPLLDRILAA